MRYSIPEESSTIIVITDVRCGSYQEVKVYVISSEMYKVWKPHVISLVIQTC